MHLLHDSYFATDNEALNWYRSTAKGFFLKRVRQYIMETVDIFSDRNLFPP